jgi:hypothetical protein
MTQRIIPLSFLVLLTVGAVSYGCSQSPEESAAAALAALCAAESSDLSGHLTPASIALAEGLRLVARQPFVCHDTTRLEFVQAGTIREGLQIVLVKQGVESLDLAMVQEDGRWLLDLFLTEESAFYTGSPEETP